jgi:signal transduction histidine kinase
MSLRTKMMASIFVFMVLVFGLLTLNLWLDAAAWSQAEAGRNADLVARMVRDLVEAWTARFPATTEEAWAKLAQKLEHSELVRGWTIVGLRDDKLEVMISSERNPEPILAAHEADLRAAFSSVRVEERGARIYVPLEADDGRRFAARLDLEGPAVPVRDIGGAVRGILAVMALGTVLLLLNTYVFTNRLVLRPLGSLVDASNRVAAGDFSKKIPEGDGYDEMSRMVRAFNLMIGQIAEYHRTLQEDVRKARGEMRDTQRKLFAAQRLTTTGTLAAGIAHEINNPLGGMINAARVLREGRLDDAKRAEYLELILDGLERVRATVQKILQFRPRSLEPQPVALREAVERAIAFLDHRCRAKEVEIRNELPADLPAVSGDPLEVQQAFLNVLMNAVDACVMGEGLVTVYHRLREGALGVHVADNGCGMDADELARCMDPFFTTKDVGEGTGLGLSVAHNIVTNHGGKIELASEHGKGTTVTLTFPLARAGVGTAGTTQAPG